MEGITQGCASALCELCGRAQAVLPAVVASLLLMRGFEDTTLTLLGGWAGAGGWGGTTSLWSLCRSGM